MAADDVAQTETYYPASPRAAKTPWAPLQGTHYVRPHLPGPVLQRHRKDSPVSSCKLQVEADIFYFFRFLIVLLKRMFNITRSFSSSLTHLWRAHAGNNKYEHVCIITFLQEEGLSSAVFTLPEKFIS